MRMAVPIKRCEKQVKGEVEDNNPDSELTTAEVIAGRLHRPAAKLTPR